MSKKIFSGKSSKKFWDAVNQSNQDILYEYGCKAQKLESINADLIAACEAQEEADNWFGASDTGRRLKDKAKKLRVDVIAKTKRNT